MDQPSVGEKDDTRAGEIGRLHELLAYMRHENHRLNKENWTLRESLELEKKKTSYFLEQFSVSTNSFKVALPHISRKPTEMISSSLSDETREDDDASAVFREEMRALNEKVSSVSGAHHHLLATVKQHEQELGFLQQQNDHLVHRVSEKESQAASLYSKLSSFDETFKSHSCEAKHQTNVLEQALGTIELIAAERNETVQQLDRASRKIGGLELENERITEAYTVNQAQVGELEENLRSHIMMIETKEVEINEKYALISSIEVQCTDAGIRAKELSCELEAVKDEHKIVLAASEDHIAALHREVSELNGANAELKIEVQQYEDEFKLFQRHGATLTSTIHENELLVSSLHAQLEDVEESRSTLASKQNEHVTENDAFLDILERAIDTNQSVKAQLKEALDQIDKMKRATEDSFREQQKLLDAVSRLQLEKIKLDEAHQESQKQTELLTESLRVNTLRAEEKDATLGEMSSLVTSVQSQLVFLSAEKEKMCRTFEATKDEHRDVLAVSNKKISELQEEMSNMSGTASELRRTVQANETELQILRDNRKTLTATIAERDSIVLELRTQIEGCERERSKLSAEIDAHVSEMEESVVELEGALRAKDATQAERDDAFAQVAEAKKAVDSLLREKEESAVESSKIIDVLNVEKARLAESNEATRMQIEALEERITIESFLVKEKDASIAEQAAIIANIKHQLAVANGRSEDLTCKLEEVEENHSNFVAATKERVATLEQELQHQLCDVQKHKNEMESLHASRNMLSSAIAERENSISELRGKVESLEELRSELASKIDAHAIEKNELESKLEAALRSNESMVAELGKQVEQLADAKSTNERLTRDNQESSKELLRVINDLDTEKKCLEEAHQANQVQLGLLDERLREQMSLVEEKEASIAAQSVQITSISTQLNDTNSKAENLSNALEAANIKHAKALAASEEDAAAHIRKAAGLMVSNNIIVPKLHKNDLLLRSMQDERDALSNSVVEKEELLADLYVQLEGCEEEKMAFAEEISSLHEAVDEHVRERNELATKVERAVRRHEAVAIERDEMAEDIAKAKREYNSLLQEGRIAFNELLDKVKDLELQKIRMHDAEASIRLKYEESQEALRDATSQLNEKEALVAGQYLAMGETKTLLNDSRCKVKELTSVITSLSDVIKNLSAGKDSMQERNDELCSELEDLLHRLNKSEDRISCLRVSKALLEAQIQQLEKEKVSSEKEVDALKGSIEDNQKQIGWLTLEKNNAREVLATVAKEKEAAEARISYLEKRRVLKRLMHSVKGSKVEYRNL